MNADNIAELMVDLFTRLVQDGVSSFETQTGLDPDTQDLLAMHYLRESKEAIARLEREMLATTTLDFTTLGAALGISKQAARQKVRVAQEAQREFEAARAGSTEPRYAPITLEWAVKNLPPVQHRVRNQVGNPHLTAVVDPYADLPERELTTTLSIDAVGRGKRLRVGEDTSDDAPASA